LRQFTIFIRHRIVPATNAVVVVSRTAQTRMNRTNEQVKLMNAKCLSSSEVHLFPRERLASEPGEGQSAGSSPPPLVLAGGPARLEVDPAGRPRLIPVPAEGHHAAHLVEPIIARGPQPRLLLISPPGAPTRVNGLPAPPVTVLGPGDEFHVAPSCSFTVAIYHRPYHGAVPPELTDVACPVCTIPLRPGDRCLVCLCGAPLHAAEDETVAGALACARMASACPRCQQPLRLEPAYEGLADSPLSQ
jgi:hypothetical protein